MGQPQFPLLTIERSLAGFHVPPRQGYAISTIYMPAQQEHYADLSILYRIFTRKGKP